MKELLTQGIICVKDELGIEYQLCEIDYHLWENEEFEYRFRPNYSVIELLGPPLFQGIPGLNLDLHKEEYVRRNRVPVFISERSPGPNRENLWELLEACGMDYLNQLEWLIRTDMKYSGDPLYVKAASDGTGEEMICIDQELAGAKRSADRIRRILAYICKGSRIQYDGFAIDDSNRKSCYELLHRLYEKETGYLKAQQKVGVEKAKRAGKYRGRKPVSLSFSKFDQVYQEYRTKQISAEEAAKELGISRSTFFRKVKKLR